MKTLTAALTTALGAPVQQPGLLIEAGFATVRRWSSRDTRSWNAQTWTAAPVRIDDLRIGALQVSGTLRLDNREGEFGALVLSEGVQDRAFRIWGFDAAAAATADVVWLCDAAGASAQVDDREVAVTLAHRAERTVAPRVFVGSDQAVLTQLLPAGTVLRINGQNYTLERR